MSLLKYNQLLNFNDEKDFLKKELSFIDKILPSIKKNFILKILIFILILIMLYKYHKFFIIIISILLIQYIKFKRTKHGINFEIEPSYLIALAITLTYGLEYGVIFIILPLVLSFSGFNIGVIVNFSNKLIFIISVYLYWTFTKNIFFLTYFAIFIVILTDVIGFFIRKRFGQNLLEILQVVLTNSIIRWIYFSFFLNLIINIIK
ncbi:MAG: hypothetical protein QXE31_01695 [Candidatus Woesearchaeota archaeon]